MPDIELTNFTAGELSPRMRGRTDVSKYWNGVESLLNFVVQPQGGVTRRPGTQYIASAANSANRIYLVPFVFSTVQAYVLEFGPNYIRIYRTDGQVISGGSPVQVATPWGASDLPLVTFVQSADTLFLFHPNYPPQLLTRSSDVTWAIAAASFNDGPYLYNNATSTTLTASGVAWPGTIITLSFSSIVGINPTAGNSGTGFQSGDVGRPIRFSLTGYTWSWGTITGVLGTTQVYCLIKDTVPFGAQGGTDGQQWRNNIYYFAGAYVSNGGRYYQCAQSGTSNPIGTGPSGTGANIADYGAVWNYFAYATPLTTTQWALGKWSGTTGYPWCGMFWQGRLLVGATNNQPSALEGSVPGQFFNFAPSQHDGSVVASNALSWIISDDEVNAINWLATAGSAQAMQLALGTRGGEQIFQGSSTGQALSPTNVQAYRETTLGSQPGLKPVRVGKSLLFANRAGQKIHEWTFSWQVNGYVGPDLAVLSEHVLRTGVTKMVWQQNPLGVMWMIAGTSLVGMTYLREQDVVAFHRHQLGGQYYGGAPVVEDLAVIPSPDTTYDTNCG